MKEIKFEICGKKYPAKLTVSKYQKYDNLALIAEYDYEGEKESIVLSTNIIELPPNMVCLDENNLTNYGLWDTITEFIRENELADIRGYIPSGYCEYPLYEFDLAKLGEVCS